jgi:putative transcriptional regulator
VSAAVSHLDELLFELALGTLAASELAAAEQHLAGCAHCAAELAATREIVAALPLEGAPATAARDGKRRLLDEVARGGRLHRFADGVADLLGIPLERAKYWLDRLDAPDAWSPLPLPGVNGISICAPDHHPSLEGCAVAFLRIKPGAQFPTHSHMASERVLILQGGYVDDVTGIEYHPGDIHYEPDGSTHSYTGIAGPDCYCLGVVLGHVKVGDIVI